jgi:rSAM/selenodomain-associated transferase 2/rSAM/selenodomain-associated transferase 1
MKSRLIIFTRYPLPGTTKTRLIPTLGPDGAAELQREMTEHTVESVRSLGGQGVQIKILFEGGDAEAMSNWLGDEIPIVPQGEGGLGDRMRRAFNRSFDAGMERAVIIGTDCPSLRADDVAEAFDLLEDNTLALGPATDGGYYLIGIRSDAPQWLFDLVFRDIPWGTDQVFNATMNVLAETGLDVGLLDEKADVDEPEDLVHWEKAREKGEGRRELNSASMTVSVIIPTFNEEKGIGELVAGLKEAGVEVVVADGGSTDQTVVICQELDIHIVHSPRGRAGQMNAGAMAATGDTFIFLHADTRLPEGFEDRVREAVAEGAVAGAFLFGTDMDTPSMRVIENATHFRSYRLGIVFGDQAIFATREAFFRAGGYPEQPIMEDYELWKRLAKVGRRTLIPLQVTTSARKWAEHGVWRINFINLAVTCLYVIGFSPERLAALYKRLMGSQ